MTKNFFLTMLFGALAALTSFASCQKDTIIQESALPAEIKAYVAEHFPGNKILQAEKDKDGPKQHYELILSDGIKLEFNHKKEIIEIEGKSKLPDSVIPEKIRSYVKANYPDSIILEWEIDRKKQQVKLNNGLDLEFSKSGDFLRID